MAKMNVPQMDVVRFREGDVIVASVAPLHLQGFTQWDSATITWNRTTYHENNADVLVSNLEKSGAGNTIALHPVTFESRGNIINMLWTNHHSENWVMYTTTDGFYYWNSDTNLWEYRQ